MLKKPERNTVVVNFRLTPEMRSALDYVSEKYDVTRTLIIREALQNYFKMLPEGELPHPPDGKAVPVVHQSK